MRLAVISDIHGNYRALEAVFEDIGRQRIDDIVSLGDTIGYGPEPEQVVNVLSARNIFSVMGNHELALVSPTYYVRLNPSTQGSLDITRALLSQSSLDWLASLPPYAKKHDSWFVHGCPPYSITTYLFSPSEARLTRIFQNYDEPFAFSGHTHMLELFSLDASGKVMRKELDIGQTPLDKNHRYLVIPGSVGQPRDSINNKAKYGIWDDQAATLEIRAVSYDVETTMKLIEERGFPLSNARRLKW